MIYEISTLILASFNTNQLQYIYTLRSSQIFPMKYTFPYTFSVVLNSICKKKNTSSASDGVISHTRHRYFIVSVQLIQCLIFSTQIHNGAHDSVLCLLCFSRLYYPPFQYYKSRSLVRNSRTHF